MEYSLALTDDLVRF